ncbi:MAG: hypothetical protein HC794_00830 [Nitrospiraceae bacterium]|nr:hypothetical protein [Nitrospiraceae bacterium]
MTLSMQTTTNSTVAAATRRSSVKLAAHAGGDKTAEVPWATLVAASAEYIPVGVSPSTVTSAAVARMRNSFNDDIACEVALSGVVMILENYRMQGCGAGLLEDLTKFVQDVARQRGLASPPVQPAAYPGYHIFPAG